MLSYGDDTNDDEMIEMDTAAPWFAIPVFMFAVMTPRFSPPIVAVIGPVVRVGLPPGPLTTLEPLIDCLRIERDSETFRTNVLKL